MKIIDLPPMELRKRGIRALAKELGAVGMVDFCISLNGARVIIRKIEKNG